MWLELTNLQQSYPGPWCYMGDFNAIFGSHEKIGGCLPSQISCEGLRAWQDNSSLTHLLTRGAKFIWLNKRRSTALIEMRLDRSICNDNWLAFWDCVSCCTLPRSQSEHHPILLILKKGSQTFPSSFKFLKMWTKHVDCRRLVSEVWQRHVAGCPIFVLSQKLGIEV